MAKTALSKDESLRYVNYRLRAVQIGLHPLSFAEWQKSTLF
jgi:hypothetical protein